MISNSKSVQGGKQSEACGCTWVWALVGGGCHSCSAGSQISVGEANLSSKVFKTPHLPLELIISIFAVLLLLTIPWLALCSTTPGWGRGGAGSWRKLFGTLSIEVLWCYRIIMMGSLSRRADRDGDGRITVEEILTVFKVRLW